MRWEDQGSSDNVEDRRSGGGGLGGFGGFGGGRGIPLNFGRGGLSFTSLIIIGIIMLVFGIDPRVLLDGGLPVSDMRYEDSYRPADKNNEQVKFVSAVLATTENAWGKYFNELGKTYSEPKLVLFSGGISSACGLAQSAAGPFYCPEDRKVYLDMNFFRELERRFKAPGDFAQAYVIGHEVGHHVQNLLGILPQVRNKQENASRAQANALQVRVELQADCFAGVWAKRADEMRSLLEPGDADEALAAASAIGDDTLQKRTEGRVVPESFTHGSSAQRMRWFSAGLRDGKIEACDTFGAKNL
jgi:predicted metalloprotease